MNLKDISLQISRIPSATVLGAYDKYVESGTVVTKQQAVTALAEEVMAGNIVTDDIKNAPQWVQRAPVTASTIDQAIVQATATVASRAEACALSALNRIEDMDQRVHHMDDSLTDITQAIDKLSRQANANLDTSAIHSQVTKAVADAFKPFADAVTASGAESVIGNMVSVTKIDRLPCVDVFGVDVRDMKGNPMFVDIYNAPNAPKIDPDFVWTDGILRHLLLSQRTGENTFFGGEKGTGKSQTAEQFSARTGRPYVRYNFHAQTTADDYAGAPALEDGNSVFKRGDFLQAYTSPATVILLDEISFAKAGNLATLNGFLEANSRVSYGGLTHTKGEGVLIFGADNTLGNGDESGRYAGTTAMNSATLDRFARIVQFQFMPLKVETEAVVNRTKCAPALAEHVLKAIHVARAKATTGDIVEAPSIRSVMAFIRAVSVMSVEEAWKTTVASRQPSESAPVLEAIRMSHINERLIHSLI
jgi:MoxR-like ATPase